MIPETPSDLARIIHPWGAWTDEGKGPVVVAIHGLPGSVRDFRYLAGAIDGRFRLLRVDLPGFSGVPGDYPATHVGATAYMDRIVDLVGEQVVILGHSFGTTYATAYAVAHPEKVRGLALIAPFGTRPHSGFRALPNIKGLRLALSLPYLGKVFENKMLSSFGKIGFRNISGQDVRMTFETLSNFNFDDYIKQIAALKCPTLVAWSKDDHLIEPAIVDELLPLLPSGPRLVFEEGGHNLQKLQAVELADALAEWVPRL